MAVSIARIVRVKFVWKFIIKYIGIIFCEERRSVIGGQEIPSEILGSHW